jgi:hypothetical protein
VERPDEYLDVLRGRSFPNLQAFLGQNWFLKKGLFYPAKARYISDLPIFPFALHDFITNFYSDKASIVLSPELKVLKFKTMPREIAGFPRYLERLDVEAATIMLANAIAWAETRSPENDIVYKEPEPVVLDASTNIVYSSVYAGSWTTSTSSWIEYK